MKIPKYDIFITFNTKLLIHTKSLYENNSKTFTLVIYMTGLFCCFNQLFCMPVQIIVKSSEVKMWLDLFIVVHELKLRLVGSCIIKIDFSSKFL